MKKQGAKLATDSKPQRDGRSSQKVPVVQPAPSEAEKRAIAEASTQLKQRSPRVKLNLAPKGKCYEPVAPHADVRGWQDRLTNAFGTTSHDFVDAELIRLMNLFRDRDGGIDLQAGNAALAVIDGIKPQNEVEAMLATQIAVTHAPTMKFSARPYSGNIETIPQQDSAALTLSRLQRAFTTQLETLSNLRRGGRQKVVVEHVHVYPGGQAIVGNVTHPGRGVQDKNQGQAHATDDQRAIDAARSAPMRCADPARDTLPIPSGEGQEALPDARGRARLRSPEGGAQGELWYRFLPRRGHRRAAGDEGSCS